MLTQMRPTSWMKLTQNIIVWVQTRFFLLEVWLETTQEQLFDFNKDDMG